MTRFKFTWGDESVVVSHKQLSFIEELRENPELVFWRKLTKNQKGLVRRLEAKGLVVLEPLPIEGDVVSLTNLGDAFADCGPDDETEGTQPRFDVSWTKHGPDKDGAVFYEFETKTSTGDPILLVAEGFEGVVAAAFGWKWAVEPGKADDPVYRGPALSRGTAPTPLQAMDEAVAAAHEMQGEAVSESKGT